MKETELFCIEICLAANSCYTATQRLQDLLNSGQTNVFGIFESLDSFLHNVSRVSLVLWPSKDGLHSAAPTKRKRAEARIRRGERLRSAMGIDESDSAISDRKFRHNLAHLDERLDDRVASTSGSIARANIASRQTFAHVKDEDIFELFDPDDGKLYFRGDVFDLRQALACVQSIHNKARDYGARTIGFSMF